MVKLELTERGAEMLKDVIDFWTEDFEAATQDVEHDRTHRSVDELLENMAGMHMQFAEISKIRNDLLLQLEGVPG